ncbi:MAG: Trk system potassium transporter TrkA [Proteobacteria bacterium]|nr:Trk system potassium transporter TrkA [Burkholderiales bacterium]
MKIVILGAGQVGSTVAESLVSEANDITIVDLDGDRLRDLADHLDLRTVEGNAAHPSVLRAAGAEDADLILAVTQSDQTNLVACKLAATMFRVPTRIARIRAPDYFSHPEVFGPDNFAVDVTICPEQIVTDYITKLIEFPESLQVVDFANGRVQLVAVRAFTGGPMVGRPLSEIRKHMPNVDSRVAAIFRRDAPLIPTGDTVIEHDDEVFFIAAHEHIRTVLRELRRMDRPVKRVMIAGGGNIGTRLARTLESRYQVKLIELDKRSGERLSRELDKTLILIGDSTDEELLETEHVGEMDVFCALTNDDENNIMSSLLAKRMGARRVITLINRSAYVDLVHGGQIDIAISPANTTIGSLLTRVRRGDCAAVHSLRRGAAEALEIIAHGDARSSKVIGKKIGELDLPRGASVAAIVRRRVAPADDEIACAIGPDDTVIIAHHDTVIERNDHVIVFAVSKQLVPKIEKLFAVGVGFM